MLKDITPSSTDVYTMSANGRDVLFPAAKGVVIEVDVAARRITVDKKRWLEVAVL